MVEPDPFHHAVRPYARSLSRQPIWNAYPMSLENLLSPYGVVGGVLRDPAMRGLPGYTQLTAMAGTGVPLELNCMADIYGTGRVYGDAGLARTIALAEAAERYAGIPTACVPTVWGTTAELSGSCLDVDRIPRCTQDEYDHPACPLVPFDPDAPIRWVRGTDLVFGEPTWVPAVMACYQLREAVPAERFAYRISTGHAVHSSPELALFGALCEVIERDAVAILWLQRLTPPDLAPRHHSALVQELCEWARRRHVRTRLFDATTDLSVPIVYCLQQAEHDPRVRHVVSCAAGASLDEAAEKAVLETIGMRRTLAAGTAKTNPDDLASLTDGARYMARPERAAAFDFLLAGANGRQMTGGDPIGFDENPQARLARLVDVLAQHGMQVIAVDLTTRELEAVGLCAVSVVVPDLQPLTLLPHAQFRAHPRLYAAPVAMGCRPLAPQELNPWPQPFA